MTQVDEHAVADQSKCVDGTGEAAHLGDVCCFERVETLLSFEQGGHRFLELRFRFVLLLLDGDQLLVDCLLLLHSLSTQTVCRVSLATVRTYSALPLGLLGGERRDFGQQVIALLRLDRCRRKRCR